MSAEYDMEPQTFRIDRTSAGERLDVFVSHCYPKTTRSAIRRWIDAGHVVVDGQSGNKAGRSLRYGEQIVVSPPAPPTSTLVPQSIPLQVLYRDDDLVVVDKPSGLVVHPGHGHHDQTLVHGLLGLGISLSSAGGSRRPGIVHRLDRETSGVLVVACTDHVHGELSRAFAERRVQKKYSALVWGRLREQSGTIDRGIGRSSRDPTRMAVDGIRGAIRSATTHYRTIEEMPGFAFLDIELETGRTHQIRVHLQSLNHPIVGDDRYGGRPWRGLQDPLKRNAVKAFERLALHARSLEFQHPVSGKTIHCVAPLPEAFESLLTTLRVDN